MHKAGLLLLLAGFAAANVNLMWPLQRVQNPTGVPTAGIFPHPLDFAGGCQNFACLWFNQGCQPGCSKCTDQAGGPAHPNSMSPDMCSEPNGTMEPTLMDKNLRTYQDTATQGDWTKRNPWRAPGYSPVFSPCGLAGGGATPGDWTSESLAEHIRSGAVTPPFIKRGFDGRDLPVANTNKTNWIRGSAAEVAWSLFFNRGGGYAYRLCPKSSKMTEDCFQKHHLQFASNQTWLQKGSNWSARTAITATRVSEGTFPPGSTWTKNPIPPCAGPDGSPVQDSRWNCSKPMFDPPMPGLFGDGPGSCISWAIHGPVEGFHDFYDSFGNVVYKAPCSNEQGLAQAQVFQINVFDEVLVPKNLPLGDYLLSFRFESELTPQIWTNCADITIIDAPSDEVMV